MIDAYPPAVHYQFAQAEAQPSENEAQPGATEPQPEAHEVTELNISKYLPPGAVSATVIVTINPPTGAVRIYTPGFETAPVLFRGSKSVGEIRISGPTVYVELLAGATEYQIQYLSWREP